ncbi:MAG: exodeoxyribonuclease VII large subunit [Christensenellaceae bacterium]|jgi:exodeoxyribonuclease VII large subunit|nr:exodeoxyribonuclease VII large subunit [Christensenellaceae bacterium]
MNNKNNAISVSQLNNYIKAVFESEEMLKNVFVVGDIEAIQVKPSGVFFSLKDAESTISCSCFGRNPLGAVKNGDKVVVCGSVSYWNKAGKISFIVRSVETFGLGALFLQFEELKKKLAAEGLFDEARKKPLPQKILRIGVVSSKTGAVIRDIASVARRRNPLVSIVLYNVQVQGEGAEKQIAEGINFFSDYENKVDVVIVARGGGSADDLKAFNTELVARAAFASSIPLVSAVGHETDFTLIDFIADLRAPTPSAAAELVVPELITAKEKAINLYRRLRAAILNKLTLNKNEIINNYKTAKNLIKNKLSQNETALKNALDLVSAKNPLEVLKSGYAKILDGKTAENISVDDNLRVMLYNAIIETKVKKVNKNG